MYIHIFPPHTHRVEILGRKSLSLFGSKIGHRNVGGFFILLESIHPVLLILSFVI